MHCVRDGEILVTLRTQPPALIGQVLNGRYRLIERIGAGGMGTVYKAIQEPAERPVAVKILHPELASDKESIRRFFNEARVVSRLRHPNTVTLYDFGQADSGELYIAMELMTGVSLTHLIDSRGLTLPEVMEVADQICQALEEAHDLGIIHRDLKPDNVFIDRVGSRNLVRVLDFGIAKVPDIAEHLTRTGMVFGTPAYMSPEQAQGHDLDTRSDIYTLGILLYQTLAGEPPFTADTPMQVALKQVTTAPRPVADMSLYRPLPSGLSALIMDMLEKEPINRPQRLAEVRARLLRTARELPGMKIEVHEERGETLVAASPPDTLREAWKDGTIRVPGLGSGPAPDERTRLTPAQPREREITRDLALAFDYTYRRQFVGGAIVLVSLALLAILLARVFKPDPPSDSSPSVSAQTSPQEIGAEAIRYSRLYRKVWQLLIQAPSMAVNQAVAAARVAAERVELPPALFEGQPATTAIQQAEPPTSPPPSERTTVEEGRRRGRPGSANSRSSDRRSSSSSTGPSNEGDLDDTPAVRPVLLPPVTIPVSQD
ncbi:MAG: serine/threonine protein kinase [Bradymonadales bacterium]|nr:serine/threonine protein kinase [Bradymonadales bacterium]